MHTNELLVLPTGTPILMVETVIDCESTQAFFLPELPRVHAGRLIEPHPLDEGLAPSLLMEGPFAKSLPKNSFDTRVVSWSEEGETMLIFGSEVKETLVRFWWALEDSKGLLSEIESSMPSNWEANESVRSRLYQRVIEAYAPLVSPTYPMAFGMY